MILDVDFFMERGTSSFTDQFSWIFIDCKLFSIIFITSKLFLGTFNTSKPSFRNFKKCRVLKLQALAWKDKSTRGNTGNVYASEQHTCNSTALLHEVYNDMGNLGLE
uniref:Uncharacterized protein n=1 Tax=Tanacetum cinerariifolium TaxID=118510 RepID=A0A6L2N5N1_TANCI|nr:hypothetical protein [Tanacetum cinerariifolium]